MKDDPPIERSFIQEKYYELRTLERLIIKDLSCFIDLNHPIDRALISDFREAIDEEIECIKARFINSVFSFNESYLERYIQFHQCALIRLTGNLLKYVKPETLGEVPASFRKEVFSQYLYFSLQGLLGFIEKHFSRYFDQHAWIPKNYSRIMLHEIGVNIDALKDILNLQKIDPRLIDTALAPLGNFLKDGDTTETTYREVIYLKELKKHLFHVNSRNETIEPNDALRDLLFYLNFNSPQFYNYCVNQLDAICENSETASDCIEHLARYQKKIYQIQVKPNFVLYPYYPSIKEQLINWIEKEINFLERKQNLGREEKSIVKDNGFKIIVDLSVSQLAYFLKVLVEIKIIQNANIAMLLRFFSKIIKTTKVEFISADSFRNRFYNPESGAREAVKRLLSRMLAHINSSF